MTPDAKDIWSRVVIGVIAGLALAYLIWRW